MGNFFSFLFSSKKERIEEQKSEDLSIFFRKITLEKKQCSLILNFFCNDIALKWTYYMLEKLVNRILLNDRKCIDVDYNVEISHNKVTISKEKCQNFDFAHNTCKNIFDNLMKEGNEIIISKDLYVELRGMDKIDEFEIEIKLEELKRYQTERNTKKGGYRQNKLNYLKLKKLQ